MRSSNVDDVAHVDLTHLDHVAHPWQPLQQDSADQRVLERESGSRIEDVVVGPGVERIRQRRHDGRQPDEDGDSLHLRLVYMADGS